MAICRPLDFIDRLESCDNPEQTIKKEVEYLRNSYPTLASLKSGFTQYRKHLKTLSPELAALCLESFKLSAVEFKEFKTAYILSVKKRNYNQTKIVDVDDCILKAEKLIKEKSYYSVILGLCLLTGRRSAEIATSAKFSYIDDETLLFEGQLKTKTRGEIAPYQIPVLSDTNDIIKALEYIRTKQPDLIDNPELFHNRCSKALSVRVKRHFSDFIDRSPKVKDLRPIYAIITHSTLERKGVSVKTYISDILGHGELDQTTGESYTDFYIDDEFYN